MVAFVFRQLEASFRNIAQLTKLQRLNLFGCVAAQPALPQVRRFDVSVAAVDPRLTWPMVFFFSFFFRWSAGSASLSGARALESWPRPVDSNAPASCRGWAAAMQQKDGYWRDYFSDSFALSFRLQPFPRSCWR